MADGKWRITVEDTCIGSAVCAATLPNRFEMVEHRSRPVEPETEPDAAVLATAKCCPVEAIRVVELESGKVLTPKD